MSAESHPPGARPKATLLVVEDNPATRYSLVRQLGREGFEVWEAASGKEALRRAMDQPDLIILDIQLPDVDGVEVRSRLKGNPATAEIPIVHLTSTYADGEQWAKALEEGADAFLTHPVEPIVLLATVRAQLRLREGERIRTRALERERVARRELEEAARIKDQFLATLSHELRTPLNAIVGWAHVLKEAADDPAIVQRAIATILRNCELQTQLIEDILDMSRIVTGSLRLSLEPLELGELVENTVESVAPAAAAKEIVVTTEVEPVAMVGDRRRIQQGVWNLVANAVKFNGRRGRVKVRVKRVGDSARIEVEDTGIGIAPQFLPHVFDRFSQADASVTREFSGLGLGLSIVRNIAELHGGHAGASSDGEGKGACFWIELPLRLARAEAEGGAEGAATAATASDAADEEVDPQRLAGRRVLVVDDNPDWLDIVASYLARNGLDVVAASSADEAMEISRDRSLDALVSDIAMPHCDGIELLRRLRADGTAPAFRSIAVSALAADRDRQRALAAGFDRYMVKPVDPRSLLAALAALVVGAGDPQAAG
jgi:signal transduction histidine kinase